MKKRFTLMSLAAMATAAGFAQELDDLPDLTFTPWPDATLTFGTGTEGEVVGNTFALLSGLPDDTKDYVFLGITNTNLVNVNDPDDQLTLALRFTANGEDEEVADNLHYYSPIRVDGQEVEYTEVSGYGNESINTLAGSTFEYIYLDNYGTEADFAAVKDVLEGKIAVCMRGSISFYQKANAAMANGAAGIIIFNNAEGTISMNLTGYEYDKPAVSITQEMGELLKSKAEFVDGAAPYYRGTLTVDELTAGHHELYSVIGYDPENGTYFKDVSFSAYVTDWTNATPGATYKATITYPTINYHRFEDDYESSWQLEFDVPATTVTAVIPESTGIENVTTNRNRDGRTYNLMGIRVGNDYKGIVIKNGKKTLQ